MAEEKTEGAEKNAPPPVDISQVNKFKALAGPCLVCGKMPPGVAFGITPDLAVCADCATEKPDESEEALEAAERGEAPKPRRRKPGKQG